MTNPTARETPDLRSTERLVAAIIDLVEDDTFCIPVDDVLRVVRAHGANGDDLDVVMADLSRASVSTQQAYEAVERAIAALAAPEPAPAVLDVERLARAMHVALHPHWSEFQITEGHRLGHGEAARLIAAAYAAVPDDVEAPTK